MSGPKRADVQAALNTAARAAEASRAVIAQTERDAFERLSGRLRDVLRNGGSLQASLSDAARLLGGIENAGPDTESAKQALASAGKALDASMRGTDAVDRSNAEADVAEAGARAAYDGAKAEYDRAAQALRASGSHYLHDQMAWAQSAQRKFDEAGRLAQHAAQLRASSKKAVTTSIEHAEAAVAAARRALDASDSAARAAEQRMRAAAEAARIAEEQRRAATSAVAEARIAFDSLDAGNVDKFLPGARDRFSDRLAAGESALLDGDHGAARTAVAGLVDEAAELRHESAKGRQRWDEARAAALAAQGELEALLASVDVELIEAWANDAMALSAGRSALADVQSLISSESFGTATATASAAHDALIAATVSAAAAHGQDLRRREIGDAVMDALEDLGFDISYEDGSREAPLRISGQTATPDGRGDFDIEIPLNGEVDFEVTAPEGDLSCVNAIHSLQECLAERGIGWAVTDWGHAEGHADNAGKTRTRDKTQTRTRSKG